VRRKGLHKNCKPTIKSDVYNLTHYMKTYLDISILWTIVQMHECEIILSMLRGAKDSLCRGLTSVQLIATRRVMACTLLPRLFLCVLTPTTAQCPWPAADPPVSLYTFFKVNLINYKIPIIFCDF
jgi:hypothetical protein